MLAQKFVPRHLQTPESDFFKWHIFRNTCTLYLIEHADTNT